MEESAVELGSRTAIEVKMGSEYRRPGILNASIYPGTCTRAIARGTIPRPLVNFSVDMLDP